MYPPRQQQGGMAPSWWNPQQSPYPTMQLPGQPVQEQEQQQPQAPAPAWDRTAFRDAWMGSGIQNVPDMQNWLKNTGWSQHVGLGGSKGDVMQLPSGENIDAVLAAGLGGNRGGPQWTGRGEHGGNFTPFGQGATQQQQGGIGPSWGNQGGWAGGMQQKPQFNPAMMQNMQHQMWRGQQQNRMQHRPGGIGYGGTMNRQQMMGGMQQKPQQQNPVLKPMQQQPKMQGY